MTRSCSIDGLLAVPGMLSCNSSALPPFLRFTSRSIIGFSSFYSKFASRPTGVLPHIVWQSPIPADILKIEVKKRT